MFSLLTKGLRFIRSNLALLISLFLIVLIPLLIFLLSSSLAKSFQENIDIVLQKEAMMLQSVLSPYVYDYYKEPEELQQRLKVFITENEELSQIRVFLPEGDNRFKIIASRAEEEIEEISTKESLVLAWSQNQAIAFLGKEEGARHWNIIRPFLNPKSEKVGLISISLSLESIDKAVVKELERAYIFALVSIIVILILVIQHTHLFQYVSLFKKAKAIEKTKDSFMNMAVHELRSPIVNMKNYLIEIKHKIFSDLGEEEKEDMRRVEVSVNRLNNLVSDILDVIRIEQGRLDFRLETIYPTSLIEKVRAELISKAERKGLFIKFDKNKNQEAQISVNPNRLSEILYNLIDNAIKYTPMGEILLDTKKDTFRKKFYIIIKDTGIGISAEETKHLFDRFYRVKNRETAEIEGTGLGLWIVKNLCKKMKGYIMVESIKGVGTKFILIFPLVKKSN